uniref:Uncharacterized protein n=1 Tax=Dicentrarchus labrax TaxID=13489 RepID=A0A8C4GKU3_DICLA
NTFIYSESLKAVNRHILSLHLCGDSSCVWVDVKLRDAVVHEVGDACVLSCIFICGTYHHNGRSHRLVLIDVDGVMRALEHGPVCVGICDVNKHLSGVKACAITCSDSEGILAF